MEYEWDDHNSFIWRGLCGIVLQGRQGLPRCARASWWHQGKSWQWVSQHSADDGHQRGGGLGRAIPPRRDSPSEWDEQVKYLKLIEGYTETYLNHAYKLHKKDNNWTEAETECQRAGGHLASVTN